MTHQLTAALKGILIFTLAILAMNSCKKEDNTDYYKNSYNGKLPKYKKPTENGTDTTGSSDTTGSKPTFQFESIEEYFNANIPQGENFNISASSGGTITGKKGSVISIPPNAFVTQNGNPVSGTVNIRVKEIFSNNDMIFSGVFPISNSDALNSGGEYFIEASQNGNSLKVANGSMLFVDLPAQAVDPQMELFLAGPDENADSVNWIVVDTTTKSNSGFTFNSVDNSYNINIDTLGWGNIDAFMSVSYFNCTFNLTGITGLDNTNTTAFAVFKNQNTVWPVGNIKWNYGNITNNIIHETHLAGIPLNLIVISVLNGNLYYGLLDVTPQQGVAYNIEMKSTSSENLDKIISALP